MAARENKENVAPSHTIHDFNFMSSKPTSPVKTTRKGRSKSIGPGELDIDISNQDASNRRQSAFVPTTKSILSKNEDAQKAARRKTMVNRRVSFAPEATLHTWDVIELARDQTVSTESSESTRRTSNLARSSGDSSPVRDDDNGPATGKEPGSKRRRNSGVPSVDLEDAEQSYSSGMSGSSDVSGSEEEDDSEEGGESEDDESDSVLSNDDTGTAMSLDVDDSTLHSHASETSSTNSSARLEEALRQAAQTAGTRGIEYDEFGDASMELAGDEITNALQPWVKQNAFPFDNTASLDQENVNPFASDLGAHSAQSHVQYLVQGEDEDAEGEDMSMDVTHAVGAILGEKVAPVESSPFGNDTMEMTQAVGKILGQKRRASTTDEGSPKRRKSFALRSSLGDGTMDLTMAVNSIKRSGSPLKGQRGNSAPQDQSLDQASEIDEATMEFTRAFGEIQRPSEAQRESSAEPEELTMQFTRVVGGIKNLRSAVATPQEDNIVRSPQGTPPLATPERLSPVKEQVDLEHNVHTPTAIPSTPQIDGAKSSPFREQHFDKSPSRSPRRSFRIKRPSRGQSSDANVQVEVTAASPYHAGSLSPRPPTNEQAIVYPDLPTTENVTTPQKATISLQNGLSSFSTPENRHHLGSEEIALGADPDKYPLEPGQTLADRTTPNATIPDATTPDATTPNATTPNATAESRPLVDSIKLMSTPRKETLRNMTPKKHTPRQASPMKVNTPRSRPIGKVRQADQEHLDQGLSEDLARIQAESLPIPSISLQDFLTEAGIRFMDLTTTKRRITTVQTPSKAKAAGDTGDDDSEVTLESALVAAACTVPELELYRHACHELKRYIKEGKQMINELEEQTAKETPPLIQAYMHATPDRRTALDVQMRDIKTNARLRSKEMWYNWRSQLLDELMVGLQNIGEGLIKDDEILGRSEKVIDEALPPLMRELDALRRQEAALRKTANTLSEEEKEELRLARQELEQTNQEMAEKRRLLEELQREADELDGEVREVEESTQEALTAIEHAHQVREACRGIPVSEVSAYKDSLKQLEDTFGWTITSATSSPATVSIVYKGELMLFFHPPAFQLSDNAAEQPNAPIHLTYIGKSSDHERPMTTSLRFFVQLLQAHLHALPQCTTKISDLLSLVSRGWDTAQTILEAERRMAIETLTESRILGDERLAITCVILLRPVQTKVKASFQLSVAMGPDMQFAITIDYNVEVVYGEEYNEKNMTEFLKVNAGSAFKDWDAALRKLTEKLVARGAKGARK